MTDIVPGDHGKITTGQAAALCGVSPVTVRNWINRGYTDLDGVTRKLPVAFRYKRRSYLDPAEVIKAEYATRERARRFPLTRAA